MIQGGILGLGTPAAVTNSSDVVKGNGHLESNSSPYEKTLVFFIINIIISSIFFLLYFAALKYKVNSKSIQSTSLTAQKDFDWYMISEYLLIAAVSFLWYSISLSFTVFNKWILQALFGGFQFPLLNTTVHLIIKYVFSRFYAIYVVKIENIPEITKGLFWKVCVPIGITTSFDIAFSNEAISHISISLYTIIKTTVVVWTFLWGCLFDVETFSMSKLNCILLVIVGLSITVLDGVNSSLIGIIYALLAAVSGGLRWVMVQILSECDPSCKHPVVSMYRFSGATVLTILPLAVLVELKDFIQSPFDNNNFKLYEILGFICFGGLIACLLMIVEIYLLTLTSSLTLSILGEMKEMVQILFAMFVFHDHLSVQTCLGLLVVLLSAELYRHLKKAETVANGNSNGGSNGGSNGNSNNSSKDRLQRIDSYMSDSSSSQIHKGRLYKAVGDIDKELELGQISSIGSS